MKNDDYITGYNAGLEYIEKVVNILEKLPVENKIKVILETIKEIKINVEEEEIEK